MSFQLGQTLATRSINEAMQSAPFGAFVQKSIHRHHSRDWGDCCEEDWIINDESLAMDMRILSVYNIPNELQNIDHQGNNRICLPAGQAGIFTEANRSATTILYPNEY